MDQITKLLKKLSVKDRQVLLNIVEKLINGDRDLSYIKMKNTDLYRLKYRNFRIIFHKEKLGIIVDSIKMRNDNTYNNL